MLPRWWNVSHLALAASVARGADLACGAPSQAPLGQWLRQWPYVLRVAVEPRKAYRLCPFLGRKSRGRVGRELQSAPLGRGASCFMVRAIPSSPWRRFGKLSKLKDNVWRKDGRGSACPQVDHLPNEKWTHWDLSPGPSACEADVMPLHHVPHGSIARICSMSAAANRQSCLSGPCAELSATKTNCMVSLTPRSLQVLSSALPRPISPQRAGWRLAGRNALKRACRTRDGPSARAAPNQATPPLAPKQGCSLRAEHRHQADHGN